MAGTLITISDAFRAALVAAGNTGTNAHKVVSIGLATAAFDATNKKLTKLPNELKRITTFGGQNIAADTIHVTLLDDSADQFSLFGFGFYLEDGTLAAYYSQAAAIMEKSPAAQLLLSVDTQFASIDAATLSFPAASFLNPPASETVQGVIELATQAETNAGTDDARAITPKKAAARFAPQVAPTFSGPVIVNGDTTITGIAKIGTRALFGPIADDSSTRVQVDGSVRAANYFINGQAAADAGVFGFGNANGPAVAAYGSATSGAGALVLRTAGNERARISGAGRALFGTTNDDGVNQVQIAGNSRTYGTHVAGAAGTATAWVSSDSSFGYFRTAGHATIGSENVNGFTDILAGGAARVRVLPSGRVAMGQTANDDGSSTLQVAGNGRFSGEVQSTASVAQFRAVFGNYGTMLRNDGTNVYLLQTASGDPYGTWNAYRPLSWGLSDGAVRIDQTGASTTFGGAVILSNVDGSAKPLAIRANAGQQRNLQFQTGDKNRWQLMTDSLAESGSNNGSDFYIQAFTDAGAWSFNPFVIKRSNGRVIINNGVDVIDKLSINRSNGEGEILLGQNDGYFFGNANEAGWYSPTKGKWAWNFAQSNLIVGTYPVWHSGNLPSPVQTSGANFTGNIKAPVVTVDNAAAWGTLWFNNNGKGRWTISKNGDTEQGGNAGSNLEIRAIADDGTGQTTALSINRSNAITTFAKRPIFGTATPWDTANLSPLDVNNGGTMKGDVWFDPGKRILLSEGSQGAPSLTFTNDGAPDTGIYHIGDGSFGITCNSNGQVRFTPGQTYFDTAVAGPTPNAGDNSSQLSTTAFVTAAMLNATVGQIVFEPRTAARAGYLKLNGAVVKRTDYPALWAYAQASGALVSDATWGSGSQGCFSSGDGATTFRIPELRGEFLRCWDDSRGVDGGRTLGSFQDSQNRSHAHGASSAAVGDHAHSAWTDAQGAHGHGGGTGGVGDHQHGSPYAQNTGIGSPWGFWDTSNNHVGMKDTDGDNSYYLTSPAGGHNHSIATDGSHGHNVGVGNAGSHAHTITVNADGGNETRVRNVAMLAMIRAF
ncbi:phage tail protein [Paraburkholderia bannensis]|uniref:phage tail protein n=1 Tax=Paraburkholderia bannensis TaxID=765414 RepID=UPI00069370AA|nr:phage tail protein [Paraburkholderia bannensis]